MIWDNAKIHKSKLVETFAEEHKDELFLLNLPPYSPMLNPQENVWNILKSYFYQYKSRSSIQEIIDFILDYFDNANSNPCETKALVNSRSYFK